MLTILRLDGFRVVIYPNDHSPAHVHVIGATSEAVFELHCDAGPVSLRESYAFKKKELLGKAGGSATSQAKKAASRSNGKRGGRPRKEARV